MLRNEEDVRDIPRCLLGGIIALLVPGPNGSLIKGDLLFPASLIERIFLALQLLPSPVPEAECWVHGNHIQWAHSL